METLCATFEKWYLGDGTYPPLQKRQKVNLSFYLNANAKAIANDETYLFKQIKHSNYQFCGKVIRNYFNNHHQIIIIDTGDFKFYIEEFDKTFQPRVGQFVCGHGMLLLDYYIWVENLRDYPNPPNLFYNCQVEHILKVAIPERFIHRNSGGFSSPTSLSPEEYTDNDICEIEDMANDGSSTEFYLLNLIFIHDQIAKTFT